MPRKQGNLGFESRRTRVAKRNETFRNILVQQGAGNLLKILELARQLGVPEEKAREIAKDSGLLGKERRRTIETVQTSHIDQKLLKEMFHVFETHRHLFMRFAKLFLAKGVPFEMLYDYCLDRSIANIAQFDPAKGVLSSWVTNSWQSSMKTALRAFWRQQRRERTMAAKTDKQGKEISFWGIQESSRLQPEQEISLFEQRQRLHKALQKLPKRQQAIIRRRYGIGTGISETLDTIGHALGISYESVWQQENQALEKLRWLMREK